MINFHSLKFFVNQDRNEIMNSKFHIQIHESNVIDNYTHTRLQIAEKLRFGLRNSVIARDLNCSIRLVTKVKKLLQKGCYCLSFYLFFRFNEAGLLVKVRSPFQYLYTFYCFPNQLEKKQYSGVLLVEVCRYISISISKFGLFLAKAITKIFFNLSILNSW